MDTVVGIRSYFGSEAPSAVVIGPRLGAGYGGVFHTGGRGGNLYKGQVLTLPEMQVWCITSSSPRPCVMGQYGFP